MAIKMVWRNAPTIFTGQHGQNIVVGYKGIHDTGKTYAKGLGAKQLAKGKAKEDGKGTK